MAKVSQTITPFITRKLWNEPPKLTLPYISLLLLIYVTSNKAEGHDVLTCGTCFINNLLVVQIIYCCAGRGLYVKFYAASEVINQLGGILRWKGPNCHSRAHNDHNLFTMWWIYQGESTVRSAQWLLIQYWCGFLNRKNKYCGSKNHPKPDLSCVCICSLFNDAVSVTDYIALSEMVENEWWTGKELGASGRDLIL
jgi:hypothetical protein